MSKQQPRSTVAFAMVALAWECDVRTPAVQKAHRSSIRCNAEDGCTGRLVSTETKLWIECAMESKNSAFVRSDGDDARNAVLWGLRKPPEAFKFLLGEHV